jgi:hypothetical protein
MTQEPSRCGICGRLLDQPNDPLSHDCGGDCWGCVGEIEGDPEDGYPPVIRKVQREIADGIRPASGRLRPAGGLEED